MKSLEYLFYQANATLSTLLSANESQLADLGIEFPFQRKRILYALLRFHAKPWTRNSLYIPRKGASATKNYFDLYANCLKQLIVARSAMAFHENNDYLGKSNMDEYRSRIQEKCHDIYRKVGEHATIMNSVSYRRAKSTRDFLQKRSVPSAISVFE